MPAKRNLLRLFIVLLLFVGCMDHYDRRKVFKGYFWTSSGQHTEGHLYLNGKHIGVIPYREVEPHINETSLRREALYTRLPSGKYKVEVKDRSGETFYKGVMKLKFSNSGLSIHTSTKFTDAGTHVEREADKIVTEIWY